MARYNCTLRPNAEFVGTVENADNEEQARSAVRDAYRSYENGYKPRGQSGGASVHLENLDDTFEVECEELR